MKTIKIKFEGTTALMLNNPQCINPMHPLSKALKAITSKRNKTILIRRWRKHVRLA